MEFRMSRVREMAALFTARERRELRRIALYALLILSGFLAMPLLRAVAPSLPSPLQTGLVLAAGLLLIPLTRSALDFVKSGRPFASGPRARAPHARLRPVLRVGHLTLYSR